MSSQDRSSDVCDYFLAAFYLFAIRIGKVRIPILFLLAIIATIASIVITTTH